MDAVTIAVMNFNGREILGPTLDRLTALPPDRFHLMVVDNGSTDGSPDWIKENYPGMAVHVVADDGSLNRARNWALRNAPTRLVFLCDNDLLVEPGCIDVLQEVLESREDILAVTPRMVYTEEPERIHNDVGRVHFLGISGASVRGRTVDEVPAGDPEPTIPGGIALVDTRLAREVGEFDVGYDQGWGMDAEFYIRGMLLGLECLHASRALTMHPIPRHGSGRAEAQIHNRYRFLLVLYRGRTLALLAPVLVAFELALLALFAVKGLLAPWGRAVARTFRERREIGELRRQVQTRRREPDRIYLEGTGFSGGGPFARSGFVQRLGGVVDGILGAYWRVVGRFC